MPGQANFRTEYKSKYKEHDPKKITGSTSPILKPRNKNEREPKTQMAKLARSEAGLISSETHNTREPPLQHRRIVTYDRNHNILSTSTTQQFLENGDDSEKKTNPILEYDAELQKLRKDEQDKEKQRVKMKSKRSPKRKVAFDDNKFAGKPSDLVRFKAFEPPLQRKRISPSRGNHNILRTDTVNYINGSEDATETTDDVSTVSNGDINQTRKKLIFEDNNGHSKDTNRKQKVSEQGRTFVISKDKASRDRDYDSKDTNQKPKVSEQGRTFVISKDKTSRDRDYEGRKDKIKVAFAETSPGKSSLSPRKIQRQNDLKEMQKKQNDRVSRSLQIKAGMQTIEPPLYSHPVKTEYQRQFIRKEGCRYEAPILSANQMFFRSDPNVIPTVKVTKTIPKTSEYMSQFVEFQTTEAEKEYDKEKEEDEDKENNTKNEENFAALKMNDRGKEKKKRIPKQKNGERKTKFKGLSPEKMPPAGSPSRTSVEDKRLIMPSRNVQPFFFPHGEHRKFQTEYKANFRSPTKYAIDSGAWQGADPPQLQPDKWEKESNHSDWFKEVIHLREKAEQFRTRERATHFTNTHLAWLDDEQNELLDRVSKHSSLSSQSDRGEVEERARGEEEDSHVGELSVSPIPVDERTSGADLHKARYRSSPDENECNAESDENDNESLGTSTNSDQVITGSQHGRLPTARLKQANDHRRHHLDRTTPHTGGAILSSPVKKGGKRQNKSMQTHKKIPAPKTERPYPILAWDEKPPESGIETKKGPRKEHGRAHVSKAVASQIGKQKTTYNSMKYQQNEDDTNKEFSQYKNQDHDRSFRQSLREASDIGENESKDIYDDGPVIITSDASSIEDILQTDYNTRKVEIPKFNRPPKAFAGPADDGTVTLESDGESIENLLRRSDFAKTKRALALKQKEAQKKEAPKKQRYVTSTSEVSSVVDDTSHSDVDHNERITKSRNLMPPRSFVVPTERERARGSSKGLDEEIEDLLSESSMSARSFLASDTLERAKGRNTNFWK